jgi:Tfp pilus assembly protein PilO
MMQLFKLPNFNKLLSRLSKREKFIVYAASFFIIMTILDRTVINPIYSKINSLNNQIKDRQASIAQDLHILAQKDRILNESKKYASFMDGTQPEEETVTGLLKEIENIANKSSLYIVDMKPSGLKEEKDNTRKYLVNLNCEGQMEQIMDFMYNIENSNMLLTIERYQISPKSRESSVAQVTMTISKIVMP